MYDYYLGGSDNFPADREAAERILAMEPAVRDNTRANRRFLVRAVRFLAESGIDQFIDLGAGLPTAPNVHQVVHEVRSDARVVYVDNDPVVTAHLRALDDCDGILTIEGDVRRPGNIRNDPAVQRVIDFTRPVAVLLVSLLHFFDDADAERILAGVRTWMVPGSYLVLSATGAENIPESEMNTAADIYTPAKVNLRFRTPEEMRAFVAGYDLVEPGIVPAQHWRAAEPVSRGHLLAAVARRPTR